MIDLNNLMSNIVVVSKTVLKFQTFSTTLILCEINFDQFELSKTGTFDNFGGSNCKNSPKTKFTAAKIVKSVNFDTQN